MRFRIEAICPFSDSPIKRKEILAILPLTVGVLEKPALPPTWEKCPGKKWRVAKRPSNRIRARLGLQAGVTDFSVCEHMGHLVE